jgi:hypothetical protein
LSADFICKQIKIVSLEGKLQSMQVGAPFQPLEIIETNIQLETYFVNWFLGIFTSLKTKAFGSFIIKGFLFLPKKQKIKIKITLQNVKLRDSQNDIMDLNFSEWHTCQGTNYCLPKDTKVPASIRF